MNTKQFTLNPKVVNMIDDLKKQFPDGLIVSDVIDDKGHQYVDLVQEGGGTWGIALLGYTHVLEQMGIRFLNLGGTSAGAINTLLMASCDKPEAPKSAKILEILANKNLRDFEDGDKDAKNIVKALLSKAGGLKLLFKIFQVKDNFKRDMGLNPGNAFHDWLTEKLDGFGVQDTEDLAQRMNDLPDDIRFRPDRKDLNGVEIKSRMAVIATEINTETKIEFPKMAGLFYDDVDRVNPTNYVRASMSIPVFYKPYTIENLPHNEESIIKWKEIARHEGGPPERAVLVDGGVVSNFPIDVFHRKKGLPSRPTFGVKLGLERNSNHNVNSTTKLLLRCFSAARNLRDLEFIHNNPDYDKLVAYVDTGTHNWIDFNLSKEAKIELFEEGAKAAVDFLMKFDWNAYKGIRANNFKKICGGTPQNIGRDHSIVSDNMLTDDTSKYLYAENDMLKELGIKVSGRV